jgi:hypothetical protein
MSFFKDLIITVVDYYEQQDLAPDEIASILYLPEHTVVEILQFYCRTYPGYKGDVED